MCNLADLVMRPDTMILADHQQMWVTLITELSNIVGGGGGGGGGNVNTLTQNGPRSVTI